MICGNKIMYNKNRKPGKSREEREELKNRGKSIINLRTIFFLLFVLIIIGYISPHLKPGAGVSFLCNACRLGPGAA